jgi:hypothetical protein
VILEGFWLRASGFRTNLTAVLPVVTICAAIGIACGDDGGGASPTPPTSSPPAASASNPCPAGRTVLASAEGSAPDKARQPAHVDPRTTLGDILWRHRASQARAVPLAAAAPPAAADVGDIAVIQDDGDLVSPANAFDLYDTGLRFSPRGGG